MNTVGLLLPGIAVVGCELPGTRGLGDDDPGIPARGADEPGMIARADSEHSTGNGNTPIPLHVALAKWFARKV